MKLKLIFGILLTLNSMSAIALTRSFSKLWGFYTYNGRYDQLLFVVEPQIRLVNRPGVYEQSLLTEGLGYWATKHLQLWVGNTIVNNNTSNNIAEDITLAVTGEYRLWQQVNFVNNISPINNISLRNRMEERHAERLSTWSIRFRQRLNWTIPLNSSLGIFASDEYFINVKRAPWISTDTFDQNRLLLGISGLINKNFNFTVSYLNQYLKTPIPEVNHGFVFNLIYTSSNYFL